ncbi:hypothetical protein LS74_001505 [Helicobacter magdeburgensis]|uniref:Uncharacterized protein n=1 Tax=Helicobacter magdeburgensis TaxID=471858 RepID=A0A4V6I1S6_9HELI|nr:MULTISPECIES: hypothetical protein [Helicobacter]TLD93432.1 hypothetical protein LS74_001505 [Helicobacter magdeburgensis]
MSNIYLGKEVYFDKKKNQICYGEAYISASQKKLYDKNGINITENAIKATVMFLLEEHNKHAEFLIKNKGKFRLRLERAE